MAPSSPAAGGGRWISVPPERLDRWLANFADRHGATDTSEVDGAVVVTAADRAVATFEVPFGPLRGSLTEHALMDRRIGVLLVRLGGYAAGVFEGRTLVSSKVGSRLVHGRAAAGGTSQHRFARRREGQSRVALAAAADNAVRILVPEVARLDAVVIGGDRSAVDEVLTDRRLAPLLPLVQGLLLDVPDPRLVVLRSTPDLFRAVRIHLADPPT
ncbi:MAG: acVLRF1 family peptidyl-tRNA hydrolase [Mycobacteriales bacterium]